MPWLLLATVALVGCGLEKDGNPPGGEDGGGRADADVVTDGAARDVLVQDAGPDAAPANLPPVAAFSFTRVSGVTFDARESRDPDGRIDRFSWDFGDGETGEGAGIAHVYAAAGCYTVRLTVTDDRGAMGSTEQRIAVATAAPGDEVEATVSLPRVGSLLPRDLETNVATFVVSGTVASAGWEEAIVRVSGGGSIEEQRTPVCDGVFSFEVGIVAELVASDVEVALVAGAREETIGSTTDLVAGDVLVITGQSNAVATMYVGDANENQGEFVRSFGARVEDGTASLADDAWHRAEGNATEGPGTIGQWPLRMAARLVEAHGIPIAILNGARGGEPIEYFQRNDADPTDAATSYGRLLERARRIGVTAQVRAILFYQGESDGARADAHRDGYTALAADWQEDCPNVERFYVTQVRAGCGDPTIALRDAQRRFRDTLPRHSVMSTTGLDGHDGCHFAYEDGYRNLGDRYAALLGRDLYGAMGTMDVDALDVAAATFVTDTIRIETRGDATAIVIDEGAAADFSIEGAPRNITGVRAEGTTIVVSLSAAATPPTRVRYNGHAGSGPWITNAAGVGLLAFELDVAP